MDELAALIDPSEHRRPHRLDDLARRIRWEDGWQGAGPLSVRMLLRSTGTESLRAAFAGLIAPPVSTARDAFGQLGFPLGGGQTRLPPREVTLDEIAARITGAGGVTLRFLSYNTYLLEVLALPLDSFIDEALGWGVLPMLGLPAGGALLTALGLSVLPGLAVNAVLSAAGLTPSRVVATLTGVSAGTVHLEAKPAIEARTNQLGPVIADYDLACLSEVMTDDCQARLADSVRRASTKSWTFAPGPSATGDWTIGGSGLLFAAREKRVSRSVKMVFDNRGSRLHDADAWSNKGAAMSVVDTGIGELEIFQTHL